MRERKEGVRGGAKELRKKGERTHKDKKYSIKKIEMRKGEKIEGYLGESKLEGKEEITEGKLEVNS